MVQTAAPTLIRVPEVPLPTYRGYISVTPGRKYFQDEDGQGFLVIGQNDAITWPGLESLVGRVSVEETENYILDLRAHGVTVSRVMIEYAQEQHSYFENPVGVFTPALIQFWDDFIALAEKHHLYLLLTPYDTFWQEKNWKRYPYSTAMGGPVENKRDWLTARAAIEAQKARWDFMIERWGNSPAIFAWDVMNEIDNCWTCTPDEIKAYIDEMAAYVRDLEVKTWGRSHLLTVSTAEPLPKGKLADAIYNHPALDFATTHLYISTGTRAPEDPIEAAVEIIDGVAHSHGAISTARPYIDSETGPIDKWIDDPILDQEYHHNMSWAHLASGAAGSGMRWPYTNPHWLLPTMRENLRGMARFAANLNWANFNSRMVTSKIEVNRADIVQTGCADVDMAVLWLLRDTRRADASRFDGMEVRLHDTLADGMYCIEIWETYEGCKLAEFPVAAEGSTLRFTLPLLQIAVDDVAILIKPICHD
jgi:hypothetical protein